MQSINKPFYMIKMRKVIDDIEEFYFQNGNGAYRNRLEELIELCKEKRAKVLDSDQWIDLRTHDLNKYVQELKQHVSEYQVLEYLRQKIDSLYCLQDRKNVLNTVIDSFENQNYVVFMNLVVTSKLKVCFMICLWMPIFRIVWTDNLICLKKMI